ncbi:unnamed protein product [Enterobius vermicularis]|uniref:F-box domain-containing protein n=1 Tax=Enterobius vermicularis TaxID=51028 RepID=A0A0N4V340_ENTVE|nr:unnamed protein product [Enterobius vermicularis]
MSHSNLSGSTSSSLVPLQNGSGEPCESAACSRADLTMERDEYLGESTTAMLADLTLGENGNEFRLSYLADRHRVLDTFLEWNDDEQVDFVKVLLYKMRHEQHGQIDAFLKPILQRDFIAHLPDRLAVYVLSFLDARSLRMSEAVSHAWKRVIARGALWRKLIERNISTDSVWKGITDKRGWSKFFFIKKDVAQKLVLQEAGYDAAAVEHKKNTEESVEIQHNFYRNFFPRIYNDIKSLKDNWKNGRRTLSRIQCNSEPSRGVYCLQYDDEKIVSGLRDHTIKIWRRSDLQCAMVLRGHTGSVLCLQYDDKVIISGSSDTTVRVWDVHTGTPLNVLVHHVEAVLHLRFQNGMMVTCSKDRSIVVWDMNSPTDIVVRRVLVAHRAAVNVVDFDSKYIVSASGDRTIKVWSTDTCEYVRTLMGHRRGIACLQYHDRLVVSGSSDNSIRLWDVEIGNCLKVLEGHEQLVRCIRFDSKRIVSGAYDGKIKVWDLQTALNPRSHPEAACLLTLVEHTGRVFRLQFDEFQIVSSSHDDTILIWDFLDPSPGVSAIRDGPVQDAAPGANAQAPLAANDDPSDNDVSDDEEALNRAIAAVGEEVAAAAEAEGIRIHFDGEIPAEAQILGDNEYGPIRRGGNGAP